MIKHPVVVIGLAVLLCTGACTKQRNVQNSEGKINVTAVNFPAYDFARTIAGDRVNLVMLLPPAAESHSYEPTPSDILTIQNSDIFIYTGGESDDWVEQILESMDTASMDIITLMGCVETVEEEVVEGMEEEEEEEEGPAYDEHVWTSPGNVKLIAEVIAEELCKKDEANAAAYRQNAAEYLVRLDELDAAFKAVVEGAKRKTIVLADRFPFRYFADAYGLSYFAAFPGCSTETEPSAATVAFLINKIRAENIPVVFHIELSNEKMADTISEATGAKKLLLHAAHNVSRDDFERGFTYLQLQQGNVDRLKEALW
ncbi:MAG: metal ABC transporter substrate-binding protein [Spirochaetaceae bacterium]|jgi:zinc transport system substrate-binding protein|nr:metal ABC transporter substrate-binding protein [Spirochaetaceae bacterium]